MLNMNDSILAMNIKSLKDWIDKLILWSTQWTPIENGARKSLICFVILIFPLKDIYSICSKT
jgi:hypothetical protein